MCCVLGRPSVGARVDSGSALGLEAGVRSPRRSGPAGFSMCPPGPSGSGLSAPSSVQTSTRGRHLVAQRTRSGTGYSASREAPRRNAEWKAGAGQSPCRAQAPARHRREAAESRQPAPHCQFAKSAPTGRGLDPALYSCRHLGGVRRPGTATGEAPTQESLRRAILALSPEPDMAYSNQSILHEIGWGSGDHSGEHGERLDWSGFVTMP